MSSDPIKQAIANQLQNLEASSGKKIAEWSSIINNCGLEKHGQMVSMLKEKYGLGHGNANMLVHHVKQSSSHVAENENELVTEQYKGKEVLKGWYDALAEKIKSFGSDVEFSPKKAYVSLRRKKQFALIQPSTKTRLDIGLNIKGVEPTQKLEASGSWNAMCTHRVKVEQEKDIDNEVIEWLKRAYEQAG